MGALDKSFRHLSREEKLNELVTQGLLSEQYKEHLLQNQVIDEDIANSLIENVIGQGTIPVGILPSIIVDQKNYAVPMMVEEPSVVAAASYGAKLVNNTGGFKVVTSERLMIGQIVFDDVQDTEALATKIYQMEEQIKSIADEAYPSIIKRGGGYRRIEIDTFPTENLLSLKVFVDTKDAMGANMLNTILEGISAHLKLDLHDSNDTRGAEASAHAYASKDGQYRGLATWKYDRDRQRLVGTIEVPMTLATVGGGTKVLPIAQASLDILNVASAQELGHVVVAVGLAQNFSACRALVSEGIQQGHMSLQYKSLAIVVGAQGDEISYVANALKNATQANTATAEQLLKEYRNNNK